MIHSVRYRVVADVDVHIHDLDEADFREESRVVRRMAPSDSPLRNVPDAEFLRHARALLDALLGDQERLDRLLAWFANMGVALADRLGDRPESIDRMLASIVPKLPRPQRAFVERLIASDELDWGLDPLYTATSTETSSLVVRQLPVAGPPCEARPVVLQRLYRAVIDMCAEFVELGSLEEDDLWGDFNDEYGYLGLTPAEFLAHNEVVRDAMMRDESVLDRWMRSAIACTFVTHDIQYWLDPGTPYEEILGPLIERLPMRRSDRFAAVDPQRRRRWGISTILGLSRSTVVTAATIPEYAH